ncbi:hypothetical protein H2248_011163 [Termitomyces sp. 'cryptogamus']|nr:hypothetical protein H2248_011163 [Termitomyces sp. 'cryptogamus']
MEGGGGCGRPSRAWGEVFGVGGFGFESWVGSGRVFGSRVGKDRDEGGGGCVEPRCVLSDPETRKEKQNRTRTEHRTESGSARAHSCMYVILEEPFQLLTNYEKKAIKKQKQKPRSSGRTYIVHRSLSQTNKLKKTGIEFHTELVD